MCASDHIPYAQLRTLGGLLSINLGELHHVFSLPLPIQWRIRMGAIRLNGNVWFNLPLRQGKFVSMIR